jgi:hypothetical protein
MVRAPHPVLVTRVPPPARPARGLCLRQIPSGPSQGPEVPQRRRRSRVAGSLEHLASSDELGRGHTGTIFREEVRRQKAENRCGVLDKKIEDKNMGRKGNKKIMDS